MEHGSALKKLLRETAPGMELREQEPMSRHTTFRIGGPAALMAFPKGEEEAIAAVRAAYALGIRPVILGNGSNLLVSDQGIDAFLIKTVRGLGQVSACGTILQAGSGLLLSQLAAEAQKRGLSGLEFAQGIPGSLGGGLTMNAGAYGGELSQVVRRISLLNERGERLEWDAGQADFGYRHSAFLDGDFLILGAELQLKPGDQEEIGRKMEQLAVRRREKQPLEYPSAGSTFKRPEGHFAAALIDQCGLKGLTVGGAQVSEKHAGFLINRGGATCEQMLRLIQLVRERVWSQTGVDLELEIRTLGIFSDER